MGLISKAGNVLGYIFNVRIDKWVGYSFLKSTGKLFVDAGKELMEIQKAKNPEDFETATTRLSLTQETLKTQSKRYKLFAFIFVFLGICVLCYGVLLYSYKNILGSIMTCSLAFYVFSTAFRYHFWHFQIEKNKLGCTLKEWLAFLFSFKKVSEQ